MPTREVQTITKETQKVVLKTICDCPALTVEELTSLLKNNENKISQDEILQVIHSISPNKNWHRATKEEIQKEILNYVWTLEAQILFLLPTKQKETTIADFNQIRLQNKQSKVPKDTIRYLQTLLGVDGKDLAKFRKFQKDLSIQNEIDIDMQAAWLSRIILANLDTNLITEAHELSTLLISEFKEKYPSISEKMGKGIQRACERFIEKYFPKNISVTKLKELVNSYQSICNVYKKVVNGELQVQDELKDQNKLTENIVEQLKEIKNIVSESHEGGFLSKLFTGQVKNKDGVINKIDEVISCLNELSELSNKTNKLMNDKTLFSQKLQSDYENIVFVKNQLEHDLFGLNEKFNISEEKNTSLEKELQDKTESLERAHEKIALLQQKVDGIPERDAKTNMLREDLNTAKNIAISLYSRVNKIKNDLLNQSSEKAKTNKTSCEPKSVNSKTIHKVQLNPETGETTINTLH